MDILSLSRRGRCTQMWKLRNSEKFLSRALAMAIDVDFPEGLTGPPAIPDVIVLKDKDRRFKHYCVKKLLGGCCTCIAKRLPLLPRKIAKPNKLTEPILCKCVAKSLGCNACTRVHIYDIYTYAF